MSIPPSLKMMHTGLRFALLLVLAHHTLAQFPPSPDDDPAIKTVRSPVDGNITIRYKSPPAGTCNTVFPTQKQYTGYIHLPPFTLAPIQQNYSINTFFWFVEARTSPETAPLTVFMNGGPGSSSMVGMFQEVGPCEVVEIDEDTLGTRAREWGWDRSSNMLFVDQPNQVGFSYDRLTNGSLDLLSSTYSFPPADVPPGRPSYTFLDGTFSSNDGSSTANTTAIAARAVWHILQGFLGAFPQYNPQTRANGSRSDDAVGINLFTESYGGKYGPAFAAYWEEQNERLRNGELPKDTTLNIELKSLGILQGCIDDLVQGLFYPKFAYSNTYGIQAVSLADQQNMASAFLAQDGCQQRILSCRTAVQAMDPDEEGDSNSTNRICADAQRYCNQNVIGPYKSSGLSVYDISQPALNPFPPNTYLEYLNTAAVQAAIGAPVNFTPSSPAVVAAFQATGDYNRGDQIAQLASLLERGVRVALVYGDRDYICNWLGGEAVSFSIASYLPSDYLSSFNRAGYAPIVTNASYIGGVVRQAANLSFSRIYDAGHLIAAYQPETLFTLFTRIILGTDLSSGEPVDLSSFRTAGDPNATATNSAPPRASPTCYLRSVPDTCDERQKEMLASGKGVIINGVLYERQSDWKKPTVLDGGGGVGPPGVPGTASVSDGGSSRATVRPAATSSRPATGVFTATSTPSMVGQRSPPASAGVSVTALSRCLSWAMSIPVLVIIIIVTLPGSF